MRNRTTQRERGAQFGSFAPIASSWHDAHWDLLLVCVSVLVLTSVGRIHQLFPALLPLRPTLVAGALSIALYVIDSTRARRLRTIGSRTTTWALALLLWVVLSVPGSLWPGGSFELLTDDFMKTVLMYLVIVGAVRGPRDVERLAFVYFAAAVVFASVGLARFGAASGRLDHLPYYDANDFGVFAVTALPLGIYFVFSQRRLSFRLAACAGLVPLLYAFVAAGSRGGFVALIAVAAFFLVRQTTIPTRWRVLGVLVIAVVFAAAASDSYWERMRTILHPHEDYNLTSEEGRWRVWSRGFGYMLEHPLLGVGAGSFGTAEGRLSGIKKWTAPHNAYVQLGAELGVPGLVFFICLITSTLAVLRAVERVPVGSDRLASTPPRLAQSLMASLVGYVVGACFLSLAYASMWWTVAALAVGLGKVTGTASRPVRRFPPLRMPRSPSGIDPAPGRSPW